MKPLQIIVAITLLTAALRPVSAQAQININITPPNWGPPAPAAAQYYYIPDVDGYYDLRAQRYVVLRNGQWIRTSTLAGYNPGNFHPVVVDYVGATPWVLVREHRVKDPKAKYAKVVRPAPRVIYRDRVTNLPPGQAKKIYGKDKDHHEGHGNGHGNGKGKGKGKD